MGGIASAAFADTIPRRLADYRFANESWDIRPAYEPATGLVSGIVAVAKPDAVIGDNLSVVMFVRTSGNQWSAWSWAGATRAEGVMGAKYELNIPDEDDPKWEIDEPINLYNGEDWLIPASPYMAGMLTDDPLFEPVMNSEHPEALVGMLAELGYPVATGGRPLEGGGETNCFGVEEEVPMLMAMASGVEWEMTQPQATLSEMVSVSEAVMSELPNPCIGQSAPTCTPRTTVSTGRSKRCIWITETTDVDVNGNILFCNYRARVVFVETETYTTINADCSVTRCARSRTGHLDGSQANCPPSSTPGGVTMCPTPPSCYPATPLQTVCNTLPTNPAISWTAWSRPCP